MVCGAGCGGQTTSFTPDSFTVQGRLSRPRPSLKLAVRIHERIHISHALANLNVCPVQEGKTDRGQERCLGLRGYKQGLPSGRIGELQYTVRERPIPGPTVHAVKLSSPGRPSNQAARQVIRYSSTSFGLRAQPISVVLNRVAA